MQNSGDLWLIKIPRNIRSDKMEGQEIILDEEAENSLKLQSNGAIQSAKVTKNKFSLPIVCPKSSKNQTKIRLEHGLEAEKALQNRIDDFKDLEEDADAGKDHNNDIHLYLSLTL